MGPRCQACGYDLSGLPDSAAVCPECAAPRTLIVRSRWWHPLAFVAAFSALHAAALLVFITHAGEWLSRIGSLVLGLSLGAAVGVPFLAAFIWRSSKPELARSWSRTLGLCVAGWAVYYGVVCVGSAFLWLYIRMMTD